MYLRLLCSALLAWILVPSLSAQEFQRWNGSVGGGLQVPAGEMSRFTNLSGHLVGGIGANLTEHFGINGELLWTFLPVKQSVIAQSNLLGAHGFEGAFMLNAIYRFPVTSRLGAYAIGGGGWYHRAAVLRVDQSGTVPAIICGGLLTFLAGNNGCISGDIPTNQVQQTHSSNALGGNIGAGLTMPVGEGATKLYLETRYH